MKRYGRFSENMSHHGRGWPGPAREFWGTPPTPRLAGSRPVWHGVGSWAGLAKNVRMPNNISSLLNVGLPA